MNWLCVMFLSSVTLSLSRSSFTSECASTQFTVIFLKLVRNLFCLTRLVQIMWVFSSEIHCEDTCLGKRKSDVGVFFLILQLDRGGVVH